MNDPILEAAKERGMIITEIKALGKWIEAIDKSLTEYKAGIGIRIEHHSDRLASLEGSVAVLNKVAWLLFATALVIVATAFFKLVIR